MRKVMKGIIAISVVICLMLSTFMTGNAQAFESTRAKALMSMDNLTGELINNVGTYTDDFSKNLIVNTKDVVLKDLTIKGNLYLAEGIGDGNVTLDNVKVQGQTFVQGGGEHGIILNNTTLTGILVIEKNDGIVKIVARGNTSVSNVVLNSGAILEEDSKATGKGFQKVQVLQMACAGQKIQLDGGFKSVSIEVSGASLQLVDGKVDKLDIASSAMGTNVDIKQGTVSDLTVSGKDSVINIEEESLVYKLTANSAFDVKGEGDIEIAKINADNVTMEIQPKTIVVAPNILFERKSPVSTATPTVIPTTAPPVTPPETPPIAPTIEFNLVDAQASSQTKSLFDYLYSIRGEHTLFGHQASTTEGVTISKTDGTESDVNNAVGDFPALYGWDTLCLQGYVAPYGDTEEEARNNLISVMKKAYVKGGVLTLTAHMPNFVTGGDFYDTSGNVVSHILPGGDKNGEFNEFLNMIAEFANNLKDDQGKLIPVIFRPWHENNGSWFWWGAAYTTKEQYIELYRYTVEYLRDKKGVHNFLYAYSPGSPFSGIDYNYLKTYPGDEYIDILGFDTYYSAGNEGWFDTVVQDAKLISRLAEEKGKVAAFTEFGYQLMRSGNQNLNFFTQLVDALKSDPDAKKLVYMETWSNYSTNSFYTPYRNHPTLGDHEMLNDFINFYNNDYTYFSNDLNRVYSRNVKTASENPSMHIVSPIDHNTVTTSETVIRARVLNENPSRVTYSVGDSIVETEMILDQDGYYSANWIPAANINGKDTIITVKAYAANETTLVQTITIYVEIAEKIMKQYSFDTGIDGINNNGAYPNSLNATFSHSTVDTDGKLKIDVTGAIRDDSWQEIKLGLNDIVQSVNIADVNRVKFDVMIPLEAGNSDVNASLKGIVILPPDWSDEGKYGMTTTEKKLTVMEKVTLADSKEYGKYTITVDLSDPAKRAAATDMILSIVGSHLDGSFSIYVDNIKLINAFTGQIYDPTVIDNFEGYRGNSELLATAYGVNGDGNTISLDTAHKSSGNCGMKFNYTLGNLGYTGISKNLGGRDWSGTGRLKFWLEPDGTDQKLVIQINANGIAFEAYPSLAGITPGWVEIPFSQFTTAPWDSGNVGKKLDTINAKNIKNFSIFVNAKDNAKLTSILYIDDITVIKGQPGDIPIGEETSNNASEGTLFGFETDVQNWCVENDAGTASITTEAATEGSHSLVTTFVFDQTAGTGITLFNSQGLNFTGIDRISAKVKLAAGTANVKLFTQIGSDWSWRDSGTVEVGSDEFKTLIIDLTGAAGLNDVKKVGLQISPTSGSAAYIVYLDDIYLSKVNLPFQYDFETDSSGWIAKNNDTGVDIPISISSDWYSSGSNSLKAETTLIDPGQGNVNKYVFSLTKSMNLTGKTTLSVDVKASAITGNFGLGVYGKIFIQTGSGWSWVDSGQTVLSNNTGATLTLDLTQVSNLDAVQAIGVEIQVDSGCSGDAVFYIDNVKAE